MRNQRGEGDWLGERRKKEKGFGTNLKKIFEFGFDFGLDINSNRIFEL